MHVTCLHGTVLGLEDQGGPLSSMGGKESMRETCKPKEHTFICACACQWRVRWQRARIVWYALTGGSVCLNAQSSIARTPCAL